jgi:hypothetical protein
MKIYAVVETEIQELAEWQDMDGMGKLETIAGYLMGAFEAGVKRCDPADKVADIIVFPAECPEAATLKHLLVEGTLPEEAHG